MNGRGWFESLQSKPVQRSKADLEADRLFVEKRKMLQAVQLQREATEAQERAAAAAAVSTCSCVARLSQIDLSAARSRHEEWNLLTTGKPEGATY